MTEARMKELRECVRVKMWDDPDARIAVTECLDGIERLKEALDVYGSHQRITRAAHGRVFDDHCPADAALGQCECGYDEARGKK